MTDPQPTCLYRDAKLDRNMVLRRYYNAVVEAIEKTTGEIFHGDEIPMLAAGLREKVDMTAELIANSFGCALVDMATEGPKYLTILEMEILFHIHARPFNYRNGDYSAPAVARAFERFLKAGWIRRRSDQEKFRTKIDSDYDCTPLGVRYIEALKRVAPPVAEV